MAKNYTVVERGRTNFWPKTYKERYVLRYWYNDVDWVEKDFGAFYPSEVDIEQFAQAMIEHFHKDKVEIVISIGYVYDPIKCYYGNEYNVNYWIPTDEGWVPGYDI